MSTPNSPAGTGSNFKNFYGRLNYGGGSLVIILAFYFHVQNQFIGSNLSSTWYQALSIRLIKHSNSSYLSRTFSDHYIPHKSSPHLESLLNKQNKLFISLPLTANLQVIKHCYYCCLFRLNFFVMRSTINLKNFLINGFFHGFKQLIWSTVKITQPQLGIITELFKKTYWSTFLHLCITICIGCFTCRANYMRLSVTSLSSV